VDVFDRIFTEVGGIGQVGDYGKGRSEFFGDFLVNRVSLHLGASGFDKKGEIW